MQLMSLAPRREVKKVARTELRDGSPIAGVTSPLHSLTRGPGFECNGPFTTSAS